MKILSIDPSSNKHETSTTGVILLDNAKPIDYWVIGYGVDNFRDWFERIGKQLDYDLAIVEEYIVKEGERSRDNTTKETMDFVVSCYPDIIIQNNTGYKSDIPDDLLKVLGLWEFGKSHHSDVRAAARLALFYAMRKNYDEVVQDIGKRLKSQVDFDSIAQEEEIRNRVTSKLNTKKEQAHETTKETQTRKKA